MSYRRNNQTYYSKEQINLSNGLSALWSGYGSGLLDIDRTGKGQDGAISGGYDWILGPDGKTQAVLFDGTNGKSAVPFKADPNAFVSRSFSICFEFWTISNATKGVVDPGTGGTGGQILVWLYSTPKLRFDVPSAGTIYSSGFSIRQWNQFCLTWDDDSKTQSIYKNGVLDAQTVQASAAGSDFNTARTWYFGSMGSNFYCNCAFGERRFYNRAITSSEAWLLGNPSHLTARVVRRQVSEGAVVYSGPPSGSLTLTGVGV